MKDLNSLLPANSGWNLTYAVGINDQGQIIGYGQYNGNLDAFLITPVPEPQSALVFLAAIVGLGLYRLRS